MSRIYLDHNATSPLRPEVKEVLAQCLDLPGANASSVHTSGRAVRAHVEQARESVAALLQVKAAQIIFTSGGTEANHLAWRAFQRPQLKILSSSLEHPCVLGAQQRAIDEGSKVDFIRFNRRGERRPQPELADAYDFVSVQAVNHETGLCLPVDEVVRQLAAPPRALHVDAVQAVGKMAIPIQDWGVSLLTLSGHKLGAPAGVGALFVKQLNLCRPLWLGSTQEKGRRGGTENVLGIIGLGAACEAVRRHGTEESQRLAKLRDHFEAELLSKLTNCEVICAAQARAPHVSNILFHGLYAESLLIALDLAGVDCSTGSACASGALEPSPVLLAMGYSEDEARSALRFSLGWNTCEADVEQAIERIVSICRRLHNSK